MVGPSQEIIQVVCTALVTSWIKFTLLIEYDVMDQCYVTDWGWRHGSTVCHWLSLTSWINVMSLIEYEVMDQMIHHWLSVTSWIKCYVTVWVGRHGLNIKSLIKCDVMESNVMLHQMLLKCYITDWVWRHGSNVMLLIVWTPCIKWYVTDWVWWHGSNLLLLIKCDVLDQLLCHWLSVTSWNQMLRHWLSVTSWYQWHIMLNNE